MGLVRSCIIRWAVVGGLLWGVALPVGAAPPAQTGTPIRYGQTVSGAITEDVACEWYWFEGRAGDAITIDMTRTSGSLDGVLALFRQDAVSAAPLAENDDRPGGGLNPLIRVTLPADDWYTIQACRLQHEQMRVTTGTFDLTLTGPASAGASEPATPASPTPAPPSGGLSESVFPSEATPTPVPPAAPPTTATPSSVSPGGLFSGWGTLQPTQADPVPLAIGLALDGTLDSAAGKLYRFPAHAGDVMTLVWQRTGGELAPMLRVVDANDVVIASTGTPSPVAALALTFRVPERGLFDDSTLALIVGRHGEDSGAPADYVITMTIDAPAGTASPPDAGAAGYLASPCQSGADAIPGIASAERLIDVYTASGDSYYVEQLTRTTTFAPDDDLNVVFRVQNASGPVSVAGVFCPPTGAPHDAGSDVFEVGGPYLLGLDWEYVGALWESGVWFVELYVDDQLELTLGFTVE